MAYLNPPITPQHEEDRSLIIFAGAGASRGVSAEKYPMAFDFRKRLPEKITSNHLYGQIIHFLGVDSEKQIDIEHILWELGKLIESIDKWTLKGNFEAYLLSTNQIYAIVKADATGQSTQAQLQGLKKIALTLQDEINEQVYSYYSQLPDEMELHRSWLPLLEQVESSGFSRVDIVTTNYDLVLETAIQAKPNMAINMGYSNGVYPGVALENWRLSSSDFGMLTKLHGSVDWKLGNGGTDTNPVIRRGHPEFDGDHGKRLILYPGFKGKPSQEPFVAFHNYFKERLKGATHVLFIGFAFRDEYINEIISSNLPSEAKVAVVDPIERLPSEGFLSGVTHLKQGFGVEKNGTVLSGDGLSPFSLSDIAQWIEGI